MTTSVDLQDDAQPLRKAAQRLRWFIRAFEEQVDRTSAETGTQYTVDRIALAEVFLEWLDAFNAQKPARPEDRPAYVGFAAGLMLRTLVRKKPVTTAARPEAADDTNPAYFWPEGYLYVGFCLNVRGLVLEKDFAGQQTLSPELHDARTWWSFKENVDQDPALAVAFLELFAGEEPNWTVPDLFRTGRVQEIAGRFFHPSLEDPRDESVP